MLMILCFSVGVPPNPNPNPNPNPTPTPTPHQVGVPVVFYTLVKQHTDRYASLDVYAVNTNPDPSLTLTPILQPLALTP